MKNHKVPWKGTEQKNKATRFRIKRGKMEQMTSKI